MKDGIRIFSGKPAYLHDTAHPDWAPTLCLGHAHTDTKDLGTNKAMERYCRARKRKAGHASDKTASSDAVLSEGLGCEGDVDLPSQPKDSMLESPLRPVPIYCLPILSELSPGKLLSKICV